MQKFGEGQGLDKGQYIIRSIAKGVVERHSCANFFGLVKRQVNNALGFFVEFNLNRMAYFYKSIKSHSTGRRHKFSSTFQKACELLSYDMQVCCIDVIT